MALIAALGAGGRAVALAACGGGDSGIEWRQPTTGGAVDGEAEGEAERRT